MRATVRPYLSAGLPLVGSAVIAVTPIAPPPEPPDTYLTIPAPRLAASSIFNVPVNVIEAFVNIPANIVAASEGIKAAGENEGNWFVYQPNNITGVSGSDTILIRALVNLLIPFPALANSL